MGLTGSGISGGSTGVPGVTTLEKIVDEVISGAAVTSIDVTGLDLDAGKLYLIFFRCINTAVSDSTISMFYNGDTTATNYYSEYIIANGAGLSANRQNTAEIGVADAGQETSHMIYLSRETGKLSCLSYYPYGEQASVKLGQRSQDWLTENNVTQITVTNAIASSIGIGSRLIIFKVSA